MTSTKIFSAAAALTSLLVITSVCKADDNVTLKPLHGASFDVGSERAASYFTSENGECKLVVTIAGEPNWEAAATFAPARLEATLKAGSATRYVAAKGKVLEFACATGALAMTVRTLDQVAELKAN